MQEENLVAHRKADHLHLALAQQAGVQTASCFDQLRFVHHPLALLSQDEIDLTTQWAGHTHAFPFYINAMTGGSKLTGQYNEQLAIVARETGLALAAGSASAMVKDPTVATSYQVMRRVNPDGFILANLGAHHSLESAQRVLEAMGANALQIHLNRPQEVVMPEGDRDFSQWLKQIERLVNGLDCSVIIKEVGFGMSQQTLRCLAEVGVKTVDVSGRGGTNFIQIEDQRHETPQFQALYQYGQTTAESLLEARVAPVELEILASGGIHQPVDIIKSLAMGARAVGLAGYFLHYLENKGLEATIEGVRAWQEQLRQLYLLLGARDWQELQATDLILTGDLRNWAQDRGLPFQDLARRHH